MAAPGVTAQTTLAMLGAAMARNVIVTEQTLRDLLEAHASLSAWYYELSAALRAAGGVAQSPSDAARAAFVDRIVADFPELAAVARTIKVPRMFVPPPPPTGPRPLEEGAEEQSTLIEPAQARYREAISSTPPQGEAAPTPGLSPPPAVDPNKVRY